MKKERRQKVLVISSPPSWGGGMLTMIEDMARVLEHLEFEPEFLFFNTGSTNLTWPFKIINTKILNWKAYQINKLPFIAWDKFPLLQYIWFFWRSAKIINKFDKYSYVGATSHFSYAFYKGRKNYVNWIATSYEDELKAKVNSGLGDIPAQKLLSGWQWKFLIRIEQDALAGARMNFVLSKHTAEKLRSLNPRAIISVMPVFIDTNLFQKKKDFSLESKRLVYAGRINDPRKNILSLLKAFKLLNRNNSSKFTLTLIGDKPIGPIAEFIKDELRANDFKYISYQPHDRLAAMLNEADIFILPSLQEGLGIAALEAMACGLPIVTAPSGGLDDIIKESRAGILADSESPDSIVRAISIIAEDNELYSKMSQAGTKYIVDKFEFEKIVAIFKQHFISTASQSRFKVVIVDFDGTLIDTNPPKISSDLIKYIEQIKNKARIIIATGRDERFIRPYLRRLNLSGLHVLAAGSKIINMSDDTYLDLKIIDHEIIKELAPIVQGYNGQIIYAADTIDGKLSQIASKKQISKISLYNLESEKSLELIESLKKFKIELSRSSASEGRVNLDITAQGASKKNAVEEVLRYYKADWTQAIAFGDSYNDLDILQAAKFSIARETAPDIVKASADYITKPNGALDGLEHIISKL